MKKTNVMLLLVAGIYSQFSAAGPIQTLNEYNLVVLNDLSSNSEVDGRTLVLGDVSGSASNYGIHLNSDAYKTSNLTLLTGNALVVGGDITSGTTINANGYGVVVGGNNNGTVNASSLTTGTVSLDFDLVKSEFTDFSGYLSTLAVNSLLTTSTNNQPSAAKFNITADATGLSVFNITGSDLFGNSLVQQIEATNANAASTVVINVSGTSITSSGNGNFVGDFSNSSFYTNVIWNFFQATSIDLSMQFNGSIIAPFATYTNSSETNGNVVVYNYNQTAEVHSTLFDGSIDYVATTVTTPAVSVPAPSSLFIFASALLGLLMWRRKSA